MIKQWNNAQTFFSRLLFAEPTANRDITIPNRSFTVAGTDDVATAKSEAIAYVSPILAEYTVTGSAVTSIDFSGLDINAHGGSYEIEIRLINATASTLDLYMYVNSDTTSTNYNHQVIVAGATSVTAARVNNARIVYAAASKHSFCRSAISLINGYANAVSDVKEEASSTIQWRAFAWQKTATVTNITQLTFTASVSSSIGVGSKIIIIRKDK